METIHPITVHFPVALLITAFFVETLALLAGKPNWHRVALWTLTLGALAAAAAVWTGRQAMAAAKHSFEIYQVMELHENLGYVVLSLAVLVAGWRLWARDRLSVKSRWIAWALLGSACGIMAFSAHLGGRLVYEFGVGGVYGRSGGIEVR
ncbi:MAG: DUF2231 domain-containing protein [Candidatus Omnitrophica bacterium]|nr:DUF2231 domain-containing protein [Candidatus Omnitrophota bacterium]